MPIPDLFDIFLLGLPTPWDDRSLTFHRVDGNPASNVIYFLPWNTSFRAAWRVGLLPLDFLVCYELPPATVSSDPDLVVQAVNALAADAERLILDRSVADPMIVGLSAGTFPATYLANRTGARLCSVASVDRADLAVWHSPATRNIKSRAEQNGLELSHYSEALRGCHPAQNLAGIGPHSVFVLGTRDPYIPPRCRAGLLHAIDRYAVAPIVIELDTGHFGTLRASASYQRAMLEPRRSRVDLHALLSAFRDDKQGDPRYAQGLSPLV